MTKIFFDTEFTGLHQATTLVSIGLIAETGQTFYAELTDYDRGQIDGWLQQNVIDKLTILPTLADDVEAYEDYRQGLAQFRCAGVASYVAERLKVWLAQFGQVQMWSDLLCYDWVLFVALVADYGTGNYPQLPANVYYIPMDICPLFERSGIDPDISREQFAGGAFLYGTAQKHTALWDAQVIKACYDKLVAND